MHIVTSPDGTKIATHRRGGGPPLILVHGSGTANALAWTAALRALQDHFSLYVVDRRGRGESSDGDRYAIEREFEDIAAVADTIGEPASVLGHSFGGLCALEAALLTDSIHKLVLYEPGIPLPGVPPVSVGVTDRLQGLLEAGDCEGAWITFAREIAMIPAGDIAQFTSSPLWPARVASAHTLLREMRALEGYRFDAERFKRLQIPTLLLLGGDSPDLEKAATEALDKALPNSRTAVIPGQQHVAMYTAPGLFAREVLSFLSG